MEQVADFTDEHEIEGNLAVEMDTASHGEPEDYVLNAGVNGGEDFDFEGVSETVTAYPSDVYEDQQTLERMSVEESSLSGTFNPFPDWSEFSCTRAGSIRPGPPFRSRCERTPLCGGKQTVSVGPGLQHFSCSARSTAVDSISAGSQWQASI